MAKKTGKKSSPKLFNFFVLGAGLQGTTPAMIRAKSFDQAFWIYTHGVVIPAKRKKTQLFDPNKVKDNLTYWDGRVYIEKLKVWKKIKGYPVAAIGVRVEMKFALTEGPD